MSDDTPIDRTEFEDDSLSSLVAELAHRMNRMTDIMVELHIRMKYLEQEGLLDE